MWKQIIAGAGAAGFVLLSIGVEARQAVHGLDRGVAAAEDAVALTCEEQTASIGKGNWIFGSRRDRLTDRYTLLADPAQTCAHTDVAAAARYAAPGYAIPGHATPPRARDPGRHLLSDGDGRDRRCAAAAVVQPPHGGSGRRGGRGAAHLFGLGARADRDGRRPVYALDRR